MLLLREVAADARRPGGPPRVRFGKCSRSRLPNDGAKRRPLARGRVQRDGVVVAFVGAAVVAAVVAGQAGMGVGIVAIRDKGRRGGNAGRVSVLEWGRAGVGHAGERLGQSDENKKAEQDESSSHIQADSSGTAEYNTGT